MSEMKNARIYMRVSTENQDLERQEGLVLAAKNAGYYVAGVYREKASGARSDRPELLRMINDLQACDVVIAEKMDRISRLPLEEAESLINAIRSKGAILSIPGVIDLSEIAGQQTNEITKIVLSSVQDMLLKISLQMSRDDYEDRRRRQKEGIKIARDSGKYPGRKPDIEKHQLIIELRKTNTIEKTAKLAKCSTSLVKSVCRKEGVWIPKPQP